MEVEFLILARYADVNRQDTTLNIMGAGLTGIKATDFPMVQSSAFAVMRLRFETAECGQTYGMQVVVRNERDETIHEAMDGAMEIKPPTPPNLYVVINAFFVLANVIYHEPGYYRLVLLIDGRTAKETIFKVERDEPPQDEDALPVNVGGGAT